jgi:glycosyltransferase involved in cell wall biosynthesis
VGNNCIHKVSIIVPAYNAERYIEDCLDSLVRQTYKDIEIIVIDDGSLDSTGYICDVYQEYYKKLIKVVHCSHCGVSFARLSGIRKATGKYAVFVDADDWVENDYISSMLSYMEDADVVAAGIAREVQGQPGNTIYEYNDIPSGRYENELEKRELYEKMLYSKAPYRFGVLPYMCNKMFRKDFMKQMLEKTDKRIFDGEDAAVVYQYLLLSQRIVLTDECKYHYIYHKSSVSLTDTQDAYLNASYLYQELYACFRQSEYCAVLLKQLDAYMRRLIWKKDPAAYLQVNSFSFPYDKVQPGSEIILYGMGKAGNVFYRQIIQTRCCNIIAWADIKAEHIGNTVEGIPRILPEEIKRYSFDYVVIAIQNKILACNIAEKLFSWGVEKNKIIIPEI